jgi:hypothetical protein
VKMAAALQYPVFIIFFLIYFLCHQVLFDPARGQGRFTHKSTSRSWTMPSTMLKILAGEHKGLLADLVVLEIGAMLGTEVMRNPEGYEVVARERDWEAISRLFDHAMALDPSFQQTYMLAQGWLPWDAGMLAETQKLLRTAAAHRPWDWRPGHLLGFNTYYFLNNHGEAGKIFLNTSRSVPNTPPFLAILGARLAQKGGETAAAIDLLKSMLAANSATEPENPELIDRLHALEGVLVIERAVREYEEKQGIKPASLSDLTGTGILAALPANPYGLSYCLDNQGAIHFDKPDCTAE